MTTPISFAVKPPGSSSYRPSPLGNGSNARQGPPSRRLFEQQDDDEDDDDPRSSRRHSSRDDRRNGSDPKQGSSAKDKPLVIPALPNKDWRQSARRVPTYRPDSRPKTEADEIRHERTGDGPQKSGLRRIEREVKKEEDFSVKQEPGVEPSTSTAFEAKVDIDIKPEPLSLEEQALKALLAGNQESEEERAQKDLVIAGQANTRDPYREMSEQEALKRDVVDLPEESTLDDYDSIPIEDFGLAMARGLGWDPKAKTNTAIHQPSIRPQLLGLGATPMDSTIRPTHAKHGAKKDKQADYKAKTGRGFVATNLLVKKEREGTTPSNGSSRAVTPESESSKRRRIEYDDRSRDGGRDERDRDRSSRSDRDGDNRNGYSSRDADRRRDDYETEEERARRKARERERDRERGSRYETDEERARRKARERDAYYETDEERARRKARERERDRRYDDREGGRDRR